VKKVLAYVNDIGYYSAMCFLLASVCMKVSKKEQLHHRGGEPHLLREIVRANQALIAGICRMTGVPAARFGLLRVIAVAEDDIGIMDLARSQGINAAAVTRQVKELEKDHLVRRYPDPRDRRRSYVRLTRKGMTLFEDFHERAHKLERATAAVIGAEEMRSAAEVLTRLRLLLEEHGWTEA